VAAVLRGSLESVGLPLREHCWEAGGSADAGGDGGAETFFVAPEGG